MAGLKRLSFALAFLTASIVLFAADAAQAQAGKWRMYGAAFEDILDGTNDLTTGNYCVALVDNTYTPNQATDATWTDVSADEVSGTGYTAGGTTTTFSWSRSALVVTLDATDVSWTSSTISGAKYAVVVEDSDGACSLESTDDLIAFSNLDTGGGTLSTSNGTLSIAIDAAGFMTFTAASAD